MAKSRSDTASSEFWQICSKPNNSAVIVAQNRRGAFHRFGADGAVRTDFEEEVGRETPVSYTHLRAHETRR
ncbi:hypothetical protein ACRPFF_11150, partial [Neisseria sp. SLRRB23]